MTDVADLLDGASAGLQRIVARLDDDALERVTVCEVPVRELVQHVIAGNRFAVRVLAGATTGQTEAEMGQAADNGGDLVQEVAQSCAAQTDAFKHADPAQLLHHPSGDIDYDTFLRFRVGDLVVHGWDIAVAAGLDATLDEVVARELWFRVEPHLEEMRSMGTYGHGARGGLPPDAPLQERLLEAYGRRP